MLYVCVCMCVREGRIKGCVLYVCVCMCVCEGRIIKMCVESECV